MATLIRVAVIGKRGQAARYIELLNRREDVKLASVYYPFKTKDTANLPLTRDFSKVLSSDAVIVASPTPTHAQYLQKLQSFKGYVLVEKPAVSSARDNRILSGWTNDRKSRVRVNFNLLFSPLAQTLSRLIGDPRLGRPITFDVHTNHGLAFKAEYQKSWRSRDGQSMGVLETAGVHFINLALRLFGKIKNSDADFLWAAHKEKKGPPDTAILRLRMINNVLVTLHHSYAAPTLKKWLLVGTNGFWEYDGKRACLYSPRDTFDSQGRFTEPPLNEKRAFGHEETWRGSLANSLEDFLATVKKRGRFDRADFDRALASMEPVFRTWESVLA